MIDWRTYKCEILGASNVYLTCTYLFVCELAGFATCSLQLIVAINKLRRFSVADWTERAATGGVRPFGLGGSLGEILGGAQ